MAVEVVSGLSWFAPIFAFLLVFFIMYALLSKTGVLGDNNPVLLFVSFIVASFFILEAQLVDFVSLISGWLGAFLVVIFFLLILFAFGSQDYKWKFLAESKWWAWVLLVLIVVFLVTSSSYVFNWVINWGVFQGWIGSDWFGFILLVVFGVIVSFVITKKVKK